MIADATRFLELAVRENMLTPAMARELAAKAGQSKRAIGDYCVEERVLSAIQVEAIQCLLDPHAVAGYEVEGLLGYGGVGIVYRARQPSLDRTVALKTICTSHLAGEGTSRQTAIARFQQEALAIAKLQHPNIVTAYDYGTDGERVFLAMELVDGVDLESYVKSLGRLDEALAWRIARQAAAALAHALKFGIVHRDVKPGNLLATDAPTGYALPAGTPLVKVSDFGLARLNVGGSGSAEARLTLTGAMLGTPHYMAPEQLEDPDVGFEADIYALGSTVYHMLVGQPPWAELPLVKVFAAKMLGNEMPGKGLLEHVSPAGQALLVAMMERDPGLRPQTYDELLARIGDVLQDEDATAAASVVSPGVLARQHDAEPTVVLPSARTASVVQWRRLAAGCVAGLLTIIAALAILPSRASLPPTPSYVASSTLNAARPLYQGRSIEGWHGVARAPDNGDYAGMLRILGNARLSIGEFRKMLPAPDHFGLSMRVAIDKDEALEVWLEHGKDDRIYALRIEGDKLVFGHRAGVQGSFITDGQPVQFVASAVASTLVLRLDRDEHYWLVRQSVAGEPPPARLLGWIPIVSDAPSSIHFKATSESVYLGDVELIALELIDAGI